jgi:hypothetical protein
MENVTKIPVWVDIEDTNNNVLFQDLIQDVSGNTFSGVANNVNDYFVEVTSEDKVTKLSIEQFVQLKNDDELRKINFNDCITYRKRNASEGLIDVLITNVQTMLNSLQKIKSMFHEEWKESEPITEGDTASHNGETLEAGKVERIKVENCLIVYCINYNGWYILDVSPDEFNEIGCEELEEELVEFTYENYSRSCDDGGEHAEKFQELCKEIVKKYVDSENPIVFEYDYYSS